MYLAMFKLAYSLTLDCVKKGTCLLPCIGKSFSVNLLTTMFVAFSVPEWLG